MARKTETVKVDETSYRIEQLSTTPGLKLYNQLAHVLGDAIREELKPGGTVEDLMPRIMLRALTVIPEEMQIQLGVTFAECCEVKHGEMWLQMNPDVYEQHFAGQLSHWTMWVLACLKVNFSDFLSRAKRFTPTQAMPAQPSQPTTASAYRSRPGSIGSSGDLSSTNAVTRHSRRSRLTGASPTSRARIWHST